MDIGRRVRMRWQGVHVLLLKLSLKIANVSKKLDNFQKTIKFSNKSENYCKKLANFPLIKKLNNISTKYPKLVEIVIIVIYEKMHISMPENLNVSEFCQSENVKQKTNNEIENFIILGNAIRKNWHIELKIWSWEF